MVDTTILPLTSDKLILATAGGKGANLARLVRAGLPVPPGFVITTTAYQDFVAANGLEKAIAAALAGLPAEDPAALTAASDTIRYRFARGKPAAGLVRSLKAAYHQLGQPAVAVRSSATAEDLPDLSFAGQQDTFLNVVGDGDLLHAVVRCWSSLWTARAIGYRARSGIDQTSVALAVVVQAMVPSAVSGVLFTANPLTGKRAETVIDATFGLGEALVSGLVEPDHYVVDFAAGPNGAITGKTLGSKALTIVSSEGGGTHRLAADAASQQALPDHVILELARLGQRTAALFDSPQDIEWGWAAGQLFVLQSRPITSLYPMPENLPAAPLRALISLGAVQGMLDPITPLGRDFFTNFIVYAGSQLGQRLTAQNQQVLYTAAERLFINISGALRNGMIRDLVAPILSVVEPGARESLLRLFDDPRLAVTGRGFRLRSWPYVIRFMAPVMRNVLLNLARPEARRVHIQQMTEKLLETFEVQTRAATSLGARVVLMQRMVEQLPVLFLPYLVPAVASGVLPLRVLYGIAQPLPNGVQDALAVTRGLPYNVTTEMDMALWATAARIAADATAVAYFGAHDPAGLAADYTAGQLPLVAQTALAGFLQRYGMRGVGEIDIGRPRWRDDPTQIMQVVQSYLQIDDPNLAPDAVFARGARAADEAIARLVHRIQRTPGGFVKARVTRAAAHRVRALAGLREMPKFTIIRMFGMVRTMLLDSGQQLAARGVLERADDIFFLHVDELQQLASGARRDWRSLVAVRRQTYAHEMARRQVPRLLLSDGQAFYEGMDAAGSAGTDVIVGSPVSPGVVEGIVHVVLDPRGTQLAPGEILVCPGTDPAWTPLFLTAGGLVMEVGGLMTHGSVVAREYGIPAVVGVHQATTRLQNGQRIRVDGSAGQITVL